MDNDFSNVKLALFDFDGVFTDNNVYITENGKEIVKCNRSDGIGISRIKKIGIKCYVISSEKNIVVEKRCQKLNINFKQNVLDKKIAVLDICKENNIEPENTLFLGNDINDIPALKSVGFPVAPVKEMVGNIFELTHESLHLTSFELLLFNDIACDVKLGS